MIHSIKCFLCVQCSRKPTNTVLSLETKYLTHTDIKQLKLHANFLITTTQIGGQGIVFDRFICLFISLFVSLSARLGENGWTDLREIFREGVE